MSPNYTENPERPAAPSPRRSRVRPGFLIPGIIAAVVAAAFLALGALALWGDAQKDEDGYLSTRTERIADNTRALATESLDVDLDGVGRLVDSTDFGEVRVQASSESGVPLFIGIAPTEDVERYLRGVSYSTVTDVSTGPFQATYERHDGARTPGPPAERDIWVASTEGDGRQTLDWDVADGRWSVVLMNADGSAGVDARVSVGAKVPFLDEIGWGALGAGLVLVIVAAGLIVLATRPPSGPPAQPVGTGITPAVV